MNKKLTFAVLGIVLVGSLAYGATKISADDTFIHPLAQRIAERFGLNQDEVNTFMNQVREERRNQGDDAPKYFLDQAVADGKITEEQKNLLEQKREEMQSERETHRQEMETWASENGIDLSLLGPGPGGMMGRRFGIAK